MAHKFFVSYKGCCEGAPSCIFALTKSFQNKWTFLQWVFAGCDYAFSDLEYTLFSQFLPGLFGCEITHLSVNCSHFLLG